MTRRDDWGRSRANYPPNEVNGHSLQLGQVLGQVLQQSERNGHFLEQMAGELKLMPYKIAAAVKDDKPPAQPRPRMAALEWAQLLLAAAIVAGAMAGRIPIRDGLQAASKMLGPP